MRSMIRKPEAIAVAIFLSGLFCRPGLGEGAPAAILQVNVENWVEYVWDTSDFSKFATNPTVTPSNPPKNFALQVGIADIVSVNGQSVTGTMIRNLRNFNLSSPPTPGNGIGDIARGATVVDTYEILKSDGTAIGTIIVSGLAPGPPSPGAPLAATQGNFAIVGGTGAFLGVRGQVGQAVTAQTIPLRSASITEDPSNRRQNGGGKVQWAMHIIPMERPEITMTANGPAVAHSGDFTLVSSSKPAAAGEILSLFMTGLGPTKPGVDPGNPFPQSPLDSVNSPVGVTVNGESAEVLGAVGYPGAVDGYQVNFRVPSDTPHGTATIQVTAAWIASSPITISIQ